MYGSACARIPFLVLQGTCYRTNINRKNGYETCVMTDVMPYPKKSNCRWLHCPIMLLSPIYTYTLYTFLPGVAYYVMQDVLGPSYRNAHYTEHKYQAVKPICTDVTSAQHAAAYY